jgi:hypothetical protein
MDGAMKGKKSHGSPAAAAAAARSEAPSDIDRNCRGAAMKSGICYMTAENFARLKKDMAGMQKEDGDGGQDVSANDMLLALFWRALMKARVQAAHAAPYEPGEEALLQSPVDGRSIFSQEVPRCYVGNVVLINQIYMPVAELTHPSTTLRHVAQRVRQGA